MIYKKKDTKKKEYTPSATEDCADVKSRYKRFKESANKPKFPPVEYEVPPHH